MKKLVFKKWVEVLLIVLQFIGLFMVAAFEWNSLLPYLIGLGLIFVSGTLEVMYGRN